MEHVIPWVLSFNDVLNGQFYNIDDLGSNSVSECCICPYSVVVTNI
jgi:hypothetical protein